MTAPPRDQLLRLRRTLLASTALILQLLLCWLAFAAGFMSLSLGGMLVLSFVVLSSCVLFLLAIWLNLNLRLRDPSLTMVQMCWGIGVVFFSAYFVDHLRSLFLMMALVVMMFGAFRLRLGGFVRIGLFTVACYAVLLASLWLRGAAIELRVELIQAVEFLVLLLGVSILGLEMSSLRSSLQQRNRDLQQALERIQLLAITDELTGLYNRRFANDLLAQQKALADRGSYGFVLCLLDLDLFKTVNDRFGHANGDAVLKQLAQLLRRVVRDVDFVARLGGEEFLLLVSRTDVTGAELMVERLRQAVRATQWQDCPDLQLSLSIGISAYRPVEAWEDTLLRADSALYQAKNAGRDQVVVV
ncbi:GGDEF domain-containing protein [Pseudomonas cavernae]|uniref:diguanylate cyclase n=1 Tax=Pseudomonas cavernae TaxID=2320867 RepID=A0A385Z404_9PSED|nr:GGDEF domain-containing protein [Pseudomonas cavernae]AYC33866.1 GGDEF domain-containing protein [Pseudomonas cavernae]